LLLAFLSSQHFAWESANGGSATRTWSFGLPNSPVVSVTRVGAGPLDSLEWRQYDVASHPESISSALLLLSLALWIFAAVRRSR
jgi:hypothetical protein